MRFEWDPEKAISNKPKLGLRSDSKGDLKMRFEWDPEKADVNKAKHGVGFEEAKEVFYDPHAVIIPDEEHSWNEERMKIVGASSDRLLLVVFAEKMAGSLRIISARKPNKNEKRVYQEGWL